MVDPKALRATLRWSQEQMAEFLGCEQTTVYRMEKGQPPSGSISRGLHRLQHLVDQGLVLPDMAAALAISIATTGRLPPDGSSCPKLSLQRESA